MSLTDWIVALHLLSAFSLVAAMILFWAVFLALASGGEAPALSSMARIAGIAIGIGVAGTLIFGIWLALAIDGYALWDGWIIAALVLWVVGTGAGDMAGRASREPGGLQRGMMLHGISSAAVLLVLVDMVWKPGA
jgi:uncharacterized membrane protein